MWQADFAASITSARGEELQDILESDSLEDRLFKALLLLKKEKELSQLQVDINKEVRCGAAVRCGVVRPCCWSWPWP
jgi:ATP-dependent Lon protease